LHRGAEPTGGPRGEGEGSVVCFRDVFDDCRAQPDTCVVGAYAGLVAKGETLARLGRRRREDLGRVGAKRSCLRVGSPFKALPPSGRFLAIDRSELAVNRKKLKNLPSAERTAAYRNTAS
jgi:hypothetical protein